MAFLNYFFLRIQIVLTYLVNFTVIMKYLNNISRNLYSKKIKISTSGSESPEILREIVVLRCT